MDANLIYLAWVIGLTVAGLIGLRSVGRAYRGVAAFLNLDEASWWRTTLPWPRGVQEDDQVHFHLEATRASRTSAERESSSAAIVEDVLDADAMVQPVRLARPTRIR